jgi:ribonuclease III
MAAGSAFLASLLEDPLMAGTGALEKRLGYTFSNAALLEEALTHVSAGSREHCYQRLEFLGDRVLGLVVSTMLFESFPGAPEGELSKRLADLVRKETCADVARSWQLGDELRLGEGEKRTGAKKRDAILGDACEAVIGAVFRDGGLSAADALIRANWTTRMQAPAVVPKDPKTRLQEIVQARGLPVPAYRDVGRSGPDHAPRFEVAVQVAGMNEISGHGPSKRLAERAAATAWLEREGLSDE